MERERRENESEDECFEVLRRASKQKKRERAKKGKQKNQRLTVRRVVVHAGRAGDVDARAAVPA